MWDIFLIVRKPIPKYTIPLYQSYLWESSTIDITHDTNPYKNIINQATRIKI